LIPALEREREKKKLPNHNKVIVLDVFFSYAVFSFPTCQCELFHQHFTRDFLLIFWCQKIAKALLYEKHACKMLMKLTQGRIDLPDKSEKQR